MASQTLDLDPALQGLEPFPLWVHFNQIRQIPHVSGNEAELSAYIQDWATKRGIETRKDKIGNVIVYVPASKGYETASPLILQGHMDMVPAKNSDDPFDFAKDPIEMERVETEGGAFIQSKRNRTNLGADNGIGVAALLALAEDSTLSHSPFELVFTVREETGLVGAIKLDGSLLKGRSGINVDSQEGENSITVASAGGQDIKAILMLERKESAEGEIQVFKIKVTGLPGGHSGDSIHEPRGNALIILGKILKEAASTIPGFLLHSVEGGEVNNAIPKDAEAVVAVPKDQILVLQTMLEKMGKEKLAGIKGGIGPKIQMESIRALPKGAGQGYLSKNSREKMMDVLTKIPNGVHEMSKHYPGLIRTSSSLGVAKESEGKWEAEIMVRSSDDAEMGRLTNKIKGKLESSGAKVELGFNFSGWEASPDLPLLKTAKEVQSGIQEKRYHVGLEPGALQRQLGGNADLVSIGPKIENIHSQAERVSIDSVKKWYEFLQRYVTRIAEKSVEAVDIQSIEKFI